MKLLIIYWDKEIRTMGQAISVGYLLGQTRPFPFLLLAYILSQKSILEQLFLMNYNKFNIKFHCNLS